MRAGRRGGDNVSTLEGAVLGLLALMIGFTFAMGLSLLRFRREAVLNEANAIGTTALRARLLPVPHSSEALKSLRKYVQIHLDISQRVASEAALDAAIAHANAVQEALWQQAKAVAAKDNGMVPVGLFIQSLNEMMNSQEKRLTAVRNRVPNIVLIALYGVAIFASAFTGYASGLEARRSRLPVYLMGTLVAAVILLIQDLDRPEQRLHHGEPAAHDQHRRGDSGLHGLATKLLTRPTKSCALAWMGAGWRDRREACLVAAHEPFGQRHP